MVEEEEESKRVKAIERGLVWCLRCPSATLKGTSTKTCYKWGFKNTFWCSLEIGYRLNYTIGWVGRYCSNLGFRGDWILIKLCNWLGRAIVFEFGLPIRIVRFERSLKPMSESGVCRHQPSN